MTQFIMIAIASKYVAACFPLIAAAFYTIQHIYLRTSRQLRFLDIEYKAPLYSQMMETLNGLVTIRAFEWQDKAQRRNWEILDESQRSNYLLYCLQRWLTLSVDMLIAVMATILIILTTTLRQEIGPGYMGIALTNILGFSTMMKAAITSWVSLETTISAVARVKRFVAEVKSEDDQGNVVDAPDESWPREGRVELRDLTAAYA